MRRVLTALAGVAITATALAVPAAATETNAEPPSPQALTAATNAMLRPADLAAPFPASQAKSDRIFSTGYFNPPGGQDPLPVCVYGPGYTTVSIPRDNAIGYMASYGGVTQYEYEYPSPAMAAKVWAKLSKQVVAECNSTTTYDGGGTTVSVARRIPGVPGGAQGWSVARSGSMNSVTTVHLVGDSIQLVAYLGSGKGIPAKARVALPRLATSLADRWADRDQLSLTQDATLTKAEATMVQPADVVAPLSLATGADGAWSSFQGSQPGNGPTVPCRARANLPTGAATFTTVLGSGGDVLGITGKGSVVQRVETYASTELAAQAWQKVSAAVAKCSTKPSGSITGKKPYEAAANGTSTVTVNGVPGVWTNGTETFPDFDKGFTNGSYSVYLLVGDSIQQTTYLMTVQGLKQVDIDANAVGSLAQKLADRWLGYTG